VALGLLVVVALAVLLAYRAGSRVLERQFRASLEARVELYMSMLDQEGDEGELDLTAEALVDRTAIGPPEFAQFWRRDEGGTWVPLYRTRNLADADLPLRFGADDAAELWDGALPDGRPGRWIGVETPIRKLQPDPRTGEVPVPLRIVLVLGVHRTELDGAKELLLTGLLGAGLILVLSGAGIAWLVVRRGLAPLDRFAETVRSLDVATLSRPLAVGEHPSELEPVIAGLNDLRGRVDAALRREKRLGATIAHEFRTPFSELRALTEVALQDSSDGEFAQRALEQVHGISLRLAALLELMRALSSLERRQVELPREAVAVDELVERVLEPLQERIAERGLSVARSGLAGRTAEVNRPALESIVTNLLANAVEYAPSGSRVECAAEPAPSGGLALRFHNAGPDLRPELLDRLTEAFWRGNEARSDPHHHGLGLAIAQGMAGLAGVGMRLALDGGEFTVELLLPGKNGAPASGLGGGTEPGSPPPLAAASGGGAARRSRAASGGGEPGSVPPPARLARPVEPPMILEQHYLGCLSQASYLLADPGTKSALVVDPRRDVELYLERARALSVTIRRVLLTHVHADFVAGHLELAARTGATIHLGARARADFDFEPLEDGAVLEHGALRVVALATPGHTPESVCYLVYDLEASRERPHAILTGDTLFLGDVGRPDLLASAGTSAEELAGALYDSLRTKILPLPDATIVYPGHGAGSACGKALSNDTCGSLGEQKRTNYALQPLAREEFVELVTRDLPPAPAYFPRASGINRRGHDLLPDVLEHGLAPLDLIAVLAAQEAGATVLDVRSADAFAAAHVPGSVWVGLSGRFASWAGTVLDLEAPIVLVADPGRAREAALRLGRIGLDQVRGYLEGGGAALAALPGGPERIGRLTVDQTAAELRWADPPCLIDVRTSAEIAAARIEGSRKLPLDELVGRVQEVPRDRRVVVHCKGGYRSMIAASLMLRAGVRPGLLADVTGGFDAWEAAGHPTVLGGCGARPE